MPDETTTSRDKIRVAIHEWNAVELTGVGVVDAVNGLAELEAEVRRLYDLIDVERQDPRIAALLRAPVSLGPTERP